MEILTKNDLAKIFNVSNTAINELIATGQLPTGSINGKDIIFNPESIIRHIKNPTMKRENYIEKVKKKLWETNPTAMKKIQKIGSRYLDPWEPKKFYLERVKNKRLGFVYYVRYIDNGNVIPSHWTTRTNDYEAAERYAIENRDMLLTKYYSRDKITQPYGEMYSILRKYYAANSRYLQIDTNRGKSLGDKARKTYHNFITRQFVPYLKKNGITRFEEIDTHQLAKLQNHLLTKIKPQTIKIYLLAISNIFNHLLLLGHVKANPYKSLVKLKIRSEEITGCYEITKLKRVFNMPWKNQLHYMLCLVIYTTGMRNSEIERMRVNHLIDIGGIKFIDIPESKTLNGTRKVPLHDFVYRKLKAYCKKTGKTDLIFKSEGAKKIMSKTYQQANLALAGFTKYTPEMLAEENIKFYSGRHFWKTLMNTYGLGDIEELFMGHKVSANVAERYNHKDKRGVKRLLEKANKAIAILDMHVFR